MGKISEAQIGAIPLQLTIAKNPVAVFSDR